MLKPGGRSLFDIGGRNITLLIPENPAKVLLPLLVMGDAQNELALLHEHCTLHELRLNADYRYEIDLQRGSVEFWEERYNWGAEVFERRKCLNDRLKDYLPVASIEVPAKTQR